jgi:ABC-type multidrug transport system fused ATPase/permease subunit
MTWPIRAIANVAHVSIDHLYSAVCRVPEFILGKGYLFMALSMVFLIVTFPIYATWLVAVAWGFFILQISTGIFFILILFDKVNWITRNVKKLLAIVASTRRLVKSAPRVGSPSPVHDKPKFE